MEIDIEEFFDDVKTGKQTLDINSNVDLFNEAVFVKELKGNIQGQEVVFKISFLINGCELEIKS